MKKLLSVLTFTLMLFALACGGGDDPESVASDSLSIMEGFISEMEKAGSADDVVKAIDHFSQKMQDIAPRIKKVKETHPDFKLKPGEMGKGYEKIEEKLKELTPKFIGVMGKIMQYANDPKVKDAQKKMMEAMQEMQ